MSPYSLYENRESLSLFDAGARARTREEPDNNNDDFNPFGDDGPNHPTETLESYAANNIVNMNGRNMELLVGFREYMPDALIRYAIDLANKCCKSGVPTYSYLEIILKKLVKKKIKTVEQAQALEEAREAEKARSSPNNAVPMRKTAAQESDEFWGKVQRL